MVKRNNVWWNVANHCNALPDGGSARMPTFAKALRGLLARHGIEPEGDLLDPLRRCEVGDRCSASVAALTARAGIPEDEVMTLVYLIF